MRLARRIGLVAAGTLALVAVTWSPAGAVTNVRNNGPHLVDPIPLDDMFAAESTLF